jgi:DMSO/TMAO reductase YedYZ molybdopterin-dependent catalytic subunit
MRDDELVSSEPSRRQLAFAGVLTGAAGIATSEAAASILHTTGGPIVAVSSGVRDLTPGPLANHLVHLVKHLDKPLLVTGTTIVLLGLCAFAGLLTRRHSFFADLVFFALAAIGLAATAGENEGTSEAFAVVIGLITWLVVLRVLTEPVLRPKVPDASRRAFLVRVGAVGVGAVAIAVIGQVAGGSRRAVEQARRLLRLPITRGAQPAGADVGVSGIASWRTSASEFYKVGVEIVPPAIRPSEWTLRIHGMVDHELTLTYADLVARKFTEDWVTICCVSNEVGGNLIGNAFWSGPLIRDVLAEVGIHPDADAVKQTSSDGWTCGTPVEALLDPQRNAMLAVAMNGEPLPVEHGFPVRMIVPGLYGYVSATKWLVDLEVTQFSQFQAYWTQNGWSEKGPVKTESRIDVPRDGAGTKTGRVRVGGVAWSQHTGIEKVEYQVDGGSWQLAELGKVPSVDTWVQWAGTVDVDKGDHKLAVRATDKTGYTQTPVRRDVVPNGATGWHTIDFHSS